MASRAMTTRKSDAEWRAGLRRSLRRAAQMAGAGVLLAGLVFLTLALVSYTQTDPSPSTAARHSSRTGTAISAAAVGVGARQSET